MFSKKKVLVFYCDTMYKIGEFVWDCLEELFCITKQQNQRTTFCVAMSSTDSFLYKAYVIDKTTTCRILPEATVFNKTQTRGYLLCNIIHL